MICMGLTLSWSSLLKEFHHATAVNRSSMESIGLHMSYRELRGFVNTNQDI